MENKMPRLAVIILTKNEEANIEAAIESAAFADEILVVDSGSTDRTQELAEKHGAKFISHPMDEEGFAGQRNFALTQTEVEWVFYLDADERISMELSEEMSKIVAGNEYAAYMVKRMNIVFGQLMKYGAHRPDWCLRMFPRNAVKWDGVVHEHADTLLPIKKLEQKIYHHTYDDWNKYFNKLSQYTDMMAMKMHENGKRSSIMDISIRPVYAFFRAYFIQRGILDGELGLIFSLLHGYYTFIKYLKLRYISYEKEDS